MYTQINAVSLIFSAIVFLRRLFGLGAVLSAALIFLAAVLLSRLFGIFLYLMAFQSIEIVLIDDF